MVEIKGKLSKKFANQLLQLGDERDTYDAIFIYNTMVYVKKQRELKGIPQKHNTVLNRTAREAIQQVWQEPRLPKDNIEGLKRLKNKPFSFPWTPKARKLFDMGNGEYKGKLHLEHLTPLILITDEIISKIGVSINNETDMKEYLISLHSKCCFVVCTGEENNRLKNDKGESDDPWDRYISIELDIENIKSIIEEVNSNKTLA